MIDSCCWYFIDHMWTSDSFVSLLFWTGIVTRYWENQRVDVALDFDVFFLNCGHKSDLSLVLSMVALWGTSHGEKLIQQIQKAPWKQFYNNKNV